MTGFEPATSASRTKNGFLKNAYSCGLIADLMGQAIPCQDKKTDQKRIKNGSLPRHLSYRTTGCRMLANSAFGHSRSLPFAASGRRADGTARPTVGNQDGGTGTNPADDGVGQTPRRAGSAVASGRVRRVHSQRHVAATVQGQRCVAGFPGVRKCPVNVSAVLRAAFVPR